VLAAVSAAGPPLNPSTCLKALRYMYRERMWRASQWFVLNGEYELWMHPDQVIHIKPGPRPVCLDVIREWWSAVRADSTHLCAAQEAVFPPARRVGDPLPFEPGRMRALLQGPGSQQDGARLDHNERVTVWTDGSLDTRDDRRVAAFAGVVMDGRLCGSKLAGRVADGPLSSTLTEFMAIMATVAVVPRDVQLTVRSDSRAALHGLKMCQEKGMRRALARSSLKYLTLHLREWLARRSHPVEGRWVRGHSGVAGNEAADRLAKATHDDPGATRWSVQRLPPPPGQRHWLHHGNQVVMRRERRIVREQDEVVTADQLVEQVNAAAAAIERDAGGQRETPRLRAHDVSLVLDTWRWTLDEQGKTLVKRTARVSNKPDAAVRAYAVKQLVNLLPTQLRNHRWYPEVEVHARCPRCHVVDESATHVVECADIDRLETEYRAAVHALDKKDRLPRNVLTMLEPWSHAARLQGRPDPSWRERLRQDADMPERAIDGAIRVLVRAGIVATRAATWMPRCAALDEHHRERDVQPRARRRQMRSTRPADAHAATPTTTTMRSYSKLTHDELRKRHGAYMRRLMAGTSTPTPRGV